jgi:hypothetical protein
MFDLWLTLGSLAHLLFLIGIPLWACHKAWRLPREDWPATIALLLWITLVLGGHLASLPQKLNELSLYVPATFLGLLTIMAVVNMAVKTGGGTPLVTVPRLAFVNLPASRLTRFLKIFLPATFVLVVLASLALGLSVYPDNADSMIYRLPRAFWYVSHGSFLHPFDSLDKRVTFYPLDGVALYVPLVLYNLPGTTHSFPSLVAWALIVYTTYRFGRELGARKLLAFYAAWLVGLTPGILAQAISTNDEILAALGVLLSLYMGFRWLLTGRRVYFFLAAAAVGLSAGTKGHIVFLTPMIGLGLVLLALAIRQKPARAKSWAKAIGLPTILLSLGVIAVTVLPFLFYNYASSGRFYFFDDFKADVLNLSVSLRGMAQNLLIYLSQMVLSPIADLNFWPNANTRQAFNNGLNKLFNPFIMPFIDRNPALYHMSYRFVGITIPVSVRFVEFSLWSGFVWLLWPYQALLAWKQKFALNRLFCLIALVPGLWILVWSVSTLYMEGTATYFTFYLICGAPAAIFAFSDVISKRRNELRWIVLAFVTGSSLLIANNLFMFSGFRALPDLVYARKWPYDWDLIEDNVIQEIRAAKRVRIIMTHEKMPYFAYMHWNPRATYETPYPVSSLPNPETILQLFPVSSLYDYGFMPIKVPGKKTPGMTYLGSVRAIGKEIIFATGAGVEQRWPDQSDYIIPHVQIGANETRTRFRLWIDKDVAGLKPDDHLEFAYELKRMNDVVLTRDFEASPQLQVTLPEDPHRFAYYLTIRLRSAWNHADKVEATYRVAGPGGWLPDTQEY